MPQLIWLDERNPQFPPTKNVQQDPDGLLAVGGNLDPHTLIEAYSQGIFPWYSDGQPILWWSPSPRMILRPRDTHFGRTLIKLAKKKPFVIRVDSHFSDVIHRCADTQRSDQDGTWITQEMMDAYIRLHKAGYAHSVEAWEGDRLVGGLYGIALGKAFFGESMFSLVSGASKIAFATLVTQLSHWGFELIDCQMHTQYLASFGAKEVDRPTFERALQHALKDSSTINTSLDSLGAPTLHWKEAWEMPTHGFTNKNMV